MGAMNTASAQFPKEQADDGSFARQGDAFRQWVRADGSGDFPAGPGRYHLYVSLACPWACRIVIVRRLKRLEQVIGMTVVDPVRDERGWAFTDGPGHSSDPVNGFRFLREAYLASDPDYDERVTVPVLWDKETGRIVSNSDDDLMRMLGREFDAYGDPSVELAPAALLPEIDRLNALLYDTVNNGVYQAGFATTQAAYEAAVYRLFDTLDQLETRLSRSRYLFGETPVETDWRLFVTLIRFDPVYHGHFKCNLRRLKEYPNLWGYMKDLYQRPGIAATVDFDHIKRHYYVTHDDINPTQVVPVGPEEDLFSPHGRG
jgi:putative glutathione S-transferase